MKAETQRERELVKTYLRDYATYIGNHIVPNGFILSRPELTDELSLEECIGKVVKDPHSEFMVYIRGVGGEMINWFGFDDAGNWMTHISHASSGDFDGCVLATENEWREKLKEEAIKRGFVKGSRFVCLNGWVVNSNWLDRYTPEYDTQDNYLLIGAVNVYRLCIMKDGVWAKVSQQPDTFSSRLDALEKKLYELLKRN